ncbi:hypothetical protein M9H77_19101 [Catharanthus roseus]|uniref:Uncharacterized protein n=1 Tax=Catharanthus roseus TaxID=4058 RepID=A0ACC0B9M0_CATRO|nr:hypothetical protein M9H77_19101 [Catharanthus roseus]
MINKTPPVDEATYKFWIERRASKQQPRGGWEGLVQKWKNWAGQEGKAKWTESEKGRVPCTRPSSDNVDGLLTFRVDPLEEGRSTWRMWPNRLGRYPKNLEPGLASDMGERLLWNGALVWCLAGIDYELPELDFDDLVLGSGPCPCSPTVALHVSLNLGVEDVLMYLDSLRLPNCV